MRVTAVLVLTCAFGCSRSGSDQRASPSAAPPPASVVATAPQPIATVSAAPAPLLPTEPEKLGPPKQVVKADGITITVLTDGRIALHTTSQWNEPLDQTFASCDYYRNAIPVLERQLVPERAKLLGKVCRAK
jgi:hypothetical protein